MPEVATEQVGSDVELFLDLARKYVWWLSADEAAAWPDRVLAQVMNIGTYEDVLLILSRFGEERLARVLQEAQAGQFNARSWHYWHYKLGISELGKVPPLPVRRLS